MKERDIDGMNGVYSTSGIDGVTSCMLYNE